jgi:hypothetical protein
MCSGEFLVLPLLFYVFFCYVAKIAAQSYKEFMKYGPAFAAFFQKMNY